MSVQENKEETCKVIKRAFTAVGISQEAKYSDYPTAVPQAFEMLNRRLDVPQE